MDGELSTASSERARIQCSIYGIFFQVISHRSGYLMGRSFLTLRKKRKYCFYYVYERDPNVYHTRDSSKGWQHHRSGPSSPSSICSMSDLRLERMWEREKQGIDKIFVFSRLTRNRLHVNNRSSSTHMYVEEEWGQVSMEDSSLRSGGVWRGKTTVSCIFSSSTWKFTILFGREQGSHFKINYLKPKHIRRQLTRSEYTQKSSSCLI